MTDTRVEYWFEFASTYSYPASMRVEQLAARAGAPLLWKPFLLGPIFKLQGWESSPFLSFPAKGAYMWRDLARVCAANGIPLRKPSVFPRNALLATRVACYFAEEPWLPAFVRAVYTANFADDRDISDRTLIAELIARLGQDPVAALERAESAEGKLRLREHTEQALQHGMFGAPNLRVGDELFWGNDRLEDGFAWYCARADPHGAAFKRVPA
jgi:2-hydroxychromene-2-carboxylate isomerase